jgi:UDP-glucose 4-epimerase
MLGAAVVRELRRPGAAISVYQYRDPFDWKSPQQVQMQFGLALQEFLAGPSSLEGWEIYWAAGVGSMGSSQADLEGETLALKEFLVQLGDQLQRSCAGSGVIGFASSAGALYAGCQDFEITEASPVSAANNYADAKLAQERALEDFVLARNDVCLLIARFSTLYGPGQALGKRQGLLSHIARCALRHHPVEIFVPLDTSRDYLFVDDASRDFIASVRELRARGDRAHARIIAAERSVTISEIISTFNRLIKKRLRVVCNRNSLSALYAPRVAYRSVSPLAAGVEITRHTLLEGVGELLRAERMVYIAGSRKG